MKKKPVVPSSEPEDEWVEDPPEPFENDENAEVRKLQVGENVEGELIDIRPSKKWPSRNIYKFRELRGEHVDVIVGTTMLDRLLKKKAVGDKIRIQRLADQPSDKGNPLQVYKTFTLKQES